MSFQFLEIIQAVQNLIEILFSSTQRLGQTHEEPQGVKFLSRNLIS